MKKIKKILLGLSVPTMSLLTLTTAISCSLDSEIVPSPVATTDISNISSLSKTRLEKINEALQNENNYKPLSIALVTGIGGSVNDNSFNQSLWEAISKYSDQTKLNKNNYYEPKTSDEITSQYNALLNQSKNVWVLSSFQHKQPFNKWLKDSNNKKSLEEKGIVIIAIDWDMEDSLMKPGHFISLNYKTQEAGWVAGYASANFLGTKYSNDVNKRFVAAFGGSVGVGVTNFITGFLSGIKAYNATPRNEIVKFYQDTISLDLGFTSSTESNNKVSQIVNAKNEPQIILPVAGPFTSTVITTIGKKTNSSQMVIGVDTDQSKTFANDFNKFFTSIEKKLGSSLYDVLIDLFLKLGSKSKYIPDFVWSKDENPKNSRVLEGLSKEFVGLSSPTLKQEDLELAKNSIEKAKQAFIDAGTNLSIPKMSDDVDPVTKKNKNQEILDNLIKEINAQVKK